MIDIIIWMLSETTTSLYITELWSEEYTLINQSDEEVIQRPAWLAASDVSRHKFSNLIPSLKPRFLS